MITYILILCEVITLHFLRENFAIYYGLIRFKSLHKRLKCLFKGYFDLHSFNYMDIFVNSKNDRLF